MQKSPPPRPQILGILNITSDSFSDGGKYLTPDAAIAKGKALMSEGADILDIGPAPSNPDAAAVTPETELARLRPVLDALGDRFPLSIDSFQMATQRFAMSRGVAYLNDIQGFPDAELYPELAASKAQLILMHSVQGRGLADRRSAPEGDIIAHICHFFEARLNALEAAGVSLGRVILDPGMGFFLGDEPETSFSVLARLGEIKGRFDLPVLISVSRKSFLRKITGRAPGEAGAASQAAELLAVLAGADFIRTHEPAPLKDALTVLTAFQAQK